ncbi:MAG TPA: hypothetical protein VMD55_07825 [Terracidiphilus sp.]|nr:hypothetical protein [Terracidiphilus sp.]
MSKLVTKSLLLLSLFACAVVLPPTGAQAQVPTRPAYFHALEHLRMARAYLHDNWAWQPVQQQDNQAIAEIDAAIHEIKAAAMDDGKNINDHPPIDLHAVWHDRFQKAEILLKTAHDDLLRAEDLPQTHEYRNRALRHIDAAETIVDQAWRTAHWQ